MIEIGGLTNYQVKMLDKMWSISDEDDLNLWRASLSHQDYLLSLTLQELVEWEIIDEFLRDDHDLDSSKKLLKGFLKG